MLNAIIRIAITAALTVALVLPASAEPVAPGAAIQETKLDTAVKGVETFYKKVTDFKADFAQEVKRAGRNRPLKKSGKVYFKNPGMMRWDYVQPSRVYYISDGEVLWSYEQETRQAIKMKVKDSDLYDSLKFLFGQGDLRGSFDITLAAVAREDDGLVGLVLVPKAGQSNYKSLTLWAKKDSWEIQRSELVDPLDNVSIITFSDAVYDETLKPEAFNFKVPRGAGVRDLTGTKP